MKKCIALLLAVSMLLCGCELIPTRESYEQAHRETTAAPTEATAEPTAEPTTDPTTEPTTEPPPVYTNPLNGEILDGPFDGRIFAFTVSNVPDAIPHVGVVEADILMEMFVNGSVIRCLALFSEPVKTHAIGSVRSTRLMFNDIAQHYDAVLCHAGGSEQVLANARSRGIDNFNIDSWQIAEAGTSYRDSDRSRTLGWEHCLLAYGQGVVDYANSVGVATTREPDTRYGLEFVEDGTPEGGENAGTINITFKFGSSAKDTIMRYDETLGAYVYNQYNKEMADGMTNAPECFENVVIIHADITKDGMYHVTDFVTGGDGYYACGGKLIPMKWHCDSDSSPLYFTTVDGEPLFFGTGNSYFAICPLGSPLSYE